MDPYDHSATPPSRHYVHDTIRDSRYQAVDKVAADEHDKRHITGAAQSRRLAAHEAGVSPPPTVVVHPTA
jgi:hypothetical protein